MKGIVFTEFLEMVEDKFGFEAVDAMIANSGVPNNGVYTAVGTYDHQEMVQLITELSAQTKISISDLLQSYGEYLFVRFGQLYPAFLEKVDDSFTFLSSIENYIHKEVLKLYPDAQLPEFIINQKDENTLVMRYISERGMYAFAHGLIIGCLAHFDEKANIAFEIQDDIGNDVVFTITK